MGGISRFLVITNLENSRRRAPNPPGWLGIGGPTSNIQHRTPNTEPNGAGFIRCWMLDVGCSMFIISLPRPLPVSSAQESLLVVLEKTPGRKASRNASSHSASGSGRCALNAPSSATLRLFLFVSFSRLTASGVDQHSSRLEEMAVGLDLALVPVPAGNLLRPAAPSAEHRVPKPHVAADRAAALAHALDSLFFTSNPARTATSARMSEALSTPWRPDRRPPR